jgi:glutamate-1-semialdehyde 2,1-aminomutase
VIAAGPADAPVPVAGSAGQIDAETAGIAVIGWNDLAAIKARLATQCKGALARLA